ncbi:MAG TPA: ABC transporter permease [Bryobacteraceae bacterium]|nr:ABC transporter permease [Bryobacteraceae bacterium]
MSWVSVIAARMTGLFGRKRLERELDQEVNFHLQRQIEDNLEAGMSPEEARYAALRSFGPMEPMKEAYRERRAFSGVETVAQDIRYALRTLCNSPGYTITSVVVLALAIGANTAMFSALNAVLLRPLPYRAPEQLAMVWSEVPTQNVREGRTAYWNIEQWLGQTKTFADLAFFDSVSATLTNAEGAEKVSVVRHSPNLPALLGVEPSRGRMFTAREAELRQRVALISHRFWQTRFAASQGAIGSNLVIDGLPSEIIGVLPDKFEFLKLDADVWEPHTLFPDWESVRRARGSGFWTVLGRLQPDVTIEQAQAEMDAIARRLDDQMPAAGRNRGISVVPLSIQVTGHSARLALWMLAGAVFCVLLSAATYVASLSLARSASREKEIAVRAALGASYARIVRQLLAESLTLSIISGLLGLLIAVAAMRLIVVIKPVELARLDEVSLDPRVLGGALVLCLLTGILVGLTPAITLARRSLRPSDQEGGRGIAGGVATRRTRRALVITEFALAVVLLVGAGLLTRSLRSVESVSLGFRPEQVLSMQLSTTTFSGTGQRASFYSRVLEEIESLPGVETAGIVSDLFIGGNAERVVSAEGDNRDVVERMRLRSDEASPGFFRAVGTPLLRGRFFSAADGPDLPAVAIVNDALAHRLWRGLDPVGKRFRVGASDSSPWFTVVGVVGDMRRQGLENEPIPQMFESLTQNPPRLATLLVKTTADDPLKMVGAVQAAIRRVEKHVPVYGVTTLETRLAHFLAERRFQTSLLIGFSAVALLMAAIGIYGLIQYSIATRTHEIGIRMAVGAQAGEIFRMIIGEGLKLSLTGLVIGLLGALWLGQAASSLLFGVSPTDPLTFVGVSVLLTVVATAACYFPARRAMKVEPMVTLRQE